MPKGTPASMGKTLTRTLLQTGSAREAVTARQHDDSMMAAVGDDGDHGHPASQGEPHEALSAAEVDLVALSPGAAGLQVAAWIHHHA